MNYKYVLTFFINEPIPIVLIPREMATSFPQVFIPDSAPQIMWRPRKKDSHHLPQVFDPRQRAADHVVTKREMPSNSRLSLWSSMACNQNR